MLMFDLLPKEIIIFIFKLLDFIIDVKSLLKAIAITNDIKEFIHLCNNRCLKQCQTKLLNEVTPLRFISIPELSKNSNFPPIYQRKRKPLKCDFISFKWDKGPFRIFPLFYKNVSSKKNKIVLQNMKSLVDVLNIHFKKTSSLQLENCNCLQMSDCSVGISNQKFYFNGLQQLIVYGLTKSLYDHLNLDLYPLHLLKLSLSSFYSVPSIKRFDVNDWNNQTLKTVKISGLRSLENVNLPKVETLHLLFENGGISDEKNESRTTIINNLTTPCLKKFKIEIEKGCPQLISNVCIGTSIKKLILLYISESVDSYDLYTSKSVRSKLFGTDMNLFKSEIIPNFIKIERSDSSKRFNTQNVEGEGFKRNRKVYRAAEITFNLKKLKTSRINQFSFTTKNLGWSTYAKVHSSIDMDIGFIYLICLEHLENLSFKRKP